MKKYISWDIGIRNLAYCIMIIHDDNKISIEEWNIINLCMDDEKVKKVSLYSLCDRLIENLNNCGIIDSEIIVLIENQPVLKNPKMKSIQMMLYTYCVMIGCEHVILFSPRNKLKIYNGPPIICNLKNKYAQRKKLGIEYCRYIIQDNQSYLKFFESNKKKDDLSDSLLQGLSYIKKKEKMDCIQLI